jgi:O-antigen/teichoic acid export membrane protein
MNLTSASIFTLAGTFIKLVSLLIINKIMAKYLSIGEYGALGQYQAIFQIAVTIATLGAISGLTKMIAKYSENNKQKKIVIDEIQKIIIITSILIVIPMVWKFTDIFSLIINYIENKYIPYIIFITVIAIPIAALSNAATSIFVGRLLIKENTLITSITSVFSLLIAFPLVAIYGFTGAIIVLITYAITPLLFTYKKSEILKITIKKNLIRNKVIRKSLLRFSIAALITTSIIPLFQIYIRYEFNQYNMNDSIGVWQGILKLSDLSILVPVAILGNYYFPLISKIKENDNKNIDYQIKNIIKNIYPLYAIIILAMIALKEQIVILLFDDKFLDIINYLNYQLLGDFIRLPIMIISITFLARGAIKKFIVLEISSPIIQFILLKYSITNISLNLITFNYFLSFIITFILVITYIYYCNKNNIIWSK